MNAYLVPSALIIAGITLRSISAVFPEYSDPHWSEPVLEASERVGADYDSLTTMWYARKAEAETPRRRLMDVGAGVAALGASVALLFAARRVRSWRDVFGLDSPSSRTGFVALAALVWLSFIPAEWLWLDYTLRRGDYPWWADSIGIPMSQTQVFGLWGAPIIVIGAVLAVWGATLPVKLSARPIFGRSYLVAPLLIIMSILSLDVLVSGVFADPFIVPPALFTLYLLLSGRAAAARRGARLARA
jgi:hypothetical protein